MISTAEVYREKQEPLAARAVFDLDDAMTGDDSSDEQFRGVSTPTRTTGLHTSTTDLPREGCGIAAALFRWAWRCREAVSRRRKTLYGAGKLLAGN
jgi:hypothetical protein